MKNKTIKVNEQDKYQNIIEEIDLDVSQIDEIINIGSSGCNIYLKNGICVMVFEDIKQN